MRSLGQDRDRAGFKFDFRCQICKPGLEHIARSVVLYLLQTVSPKIAHSAEKRKKYPDEANKSSGLRFLLKTEMSVGALILAAQKILRFFSSEGGSGSRL